MPNPWDPEHAVDRALAEALIASQLPHLAGLPLTRVGQGWDNEVWRAGDHVLRFPRRAMGVALIAVEARALPFLAPRLEVAIPCPTHVGHPTDAFPAPFVVHPWLPGTTGDRADLGPAARAALAPVLGRFLSSLHAIPVADARAAGVPDDTFRADVDRVADQVADRLRALRPALEPEILADAERLLSARPAPGADLVVCHGDLYARHLLVDDNAALCGVIDWGDCCVGDRALDLNLAFTLLPPAARSAFFGTYGAVDPATAHRARWLALHKASALVLYALETGDRPLEREGRIALAHTLAS